jgi:hypothetical protein
MAFFSAASGTIDEEVSLAFLKQVSIELQHNFNNSKSALRCEVTSFAIS